MKSFARLAGVAALALASLATTAYAADIPLVGVTYPEGKKIDVPFTRTAIAPKEAKLTGTVKMSKGQADVVLEWEKMEPAVLFAGNITSYAAWAITRDGRPENLGELPVREKKSGEITFRTGKSSFAIIVTAEVLPGGVLPGEMILFTSGKVDQKTTAKNLDFGYDPVNPFAMLYRPGNPSIANLKYTASKDAEPIELQQARKAMEMANELKAGDVAAKELELAKTQFAQAENSTKGGGSKTAVVDYSRRALDNAATAVRMKLQKMLDEKLAAAEAARKAEEERKRKELESAKAQADAARAQAGAASAAAASAQADKARLAGEVERLKAEQERLRASLKESLGKFMTVEETARGVVLNMGDILFDVNKFTLKRDAELAIAKLSAILTVFPSMNARIEGFTDSSGKEDLNMKLSAERARSVADFLSDQGVAKTRLTHAGYGPKNPVADNATKEGRAKNRRVEIILSKDVVTPTPGGVTAPDRPAKATKPAAKPAAKADTKPEAKPAAKAEPKPEAKPAEPKK